MIKVETTSKENSLIPEDTVKLTLSMVLRCCLPSVSFYFMPGYFIDFKIEVFLEKKNNLDKHISSQWLFGYFHAQYEWKEK